MMSWEDSIADAKKIVGEALREGLHDHLGRPLLPQELTILRLRAEQILERISNEANIPVPEIDVKQNLEDPSIVTITLPPEFMQLLAAHWMETRKIDTVEVSQADGSTSTIYINRACYDIARYRS